MSQTVTQAYQFALAPTPVQAEALRSHCGAARFAYNWGLGRVKANLAQREAERSYGVPEDQLTPTLRWSAYSLRKDWNAAKSEVAPWWDANSKETYSNGLANLATALDNWRKSRNGQRAGRRVGFPGSSRNGPPGATRSPLGRSGYRTQIGGMCSCHESAWCVRTSPPANSHAACRPGRRGSPVPPWRSAGAGG